MAVGLEPSIRHKVELATANPNWTELLEDKDDTTGRIPCTYHPLDPWAQLRVLTERFGAHGFLFEIDEVLLVQIMNLKRVANPDFPRFCSLEIEQPQLHAAIVTLVRALAGKDVSKELGRSENGVMEERDAITEVSSCAVSGSPDVSLAGGWESIGSPVNSFCTPTATPGTVNGEVVPLGVNSAKPEVDSAAVVRRRSANTLNSRRLPTIDGWGFVSPAAASKDIQPLHAAAAELDKSIKALMERPGLLGVVMAAPTLAELDVLHVLLRGPIIDLAVLDEVRTQRWESAVCNFEQTLVEFMGISHASFRKVSALALELPIAELHARAFRLKNAFLVERRRGLADITSSVAPFVLPNVTLSPREVTGVLADLLGIKREVERLRLGINGIPGLTLPALWNPFMLEGQQYLRENLDWLRWHSRLLGASVDGAQPFIEALRFFFSEPRAISEFERDKVTDIRRAAAIIFDHDWTDESSLAAWTSRQPLLQQWVDSAALRRFP